MPNKYNFNLLKNTKKMEVSPEGWVYPLFVEYGAEIYSGIPSYFWRVIGTDHVFIIPILRMDFLSKGDYKKHFEDILVEFRNDYIGWAEACWPSDWMKEYKDMYKLYISL